MVGFAGAVTDTVGSFVGCSASPMGSDEFGPIGAGVVCPNDEPTISGLVIGNGPDDMVDMDSIGGDNNSSVKNGHVDIGAHKASS